jgi:RNA polymerase sporulation-specific sigma factor
MQGRLTQEEQYLVEQNMKLIHFVLKKMNITHDYEDFFGVGCIGLCVAANTWVKEKGSAFTTYACNIIRHKIINYMKCVKKSFYVPIEHCENLCLYEEKGFANFEDKQLIKLILNNLDKYLEENEAQIMRLIIAEVYPAEIARRMGIELNTIYNLRKSAIKKIKAFVKI